MNNPNITATEVPLHVMLRRRRQELKLVQADVAEALHVSPECVTLWEAGRRHMELAKLPRLAAVLQLDAKELCAKALAEFHPIFYKTLFGVCAVAPANFQRAPV
jgi:transcriptional regulator with XRE-family HTH domain